MINSTHSEYQKESLLHDNRMRMSGIIVDDLDPRCEPIADNINGSQIICLGDITFEMTYDSATFSFLTEYSTEADIASLPRIYLLKGKNLHKDAKFISRRAKVEFYDCLLDCFGGIPKRVVAKMLKCTTQEYSEVTVENSIASADH